MMNTWNYTNRELALFWLNENNQTLSDVYDRLAKAELELEELEGKVYNENEVQLEQSEFRREVIEQIIEICGRKMSKRELINAINATIENSYVELS